MENGFGAAKPARGVGVAVCVDVKLQMDVLVSVWVRDAVGDSVTVSVAVGLSVAVGDSVRVTVNE